MRAAATGTEENPSSNRPTASCEPSQHLPRRTQTPSAPPVTRPHLIWFNYGYAIVGIVELFWDVCKRNLGDICLQTKYRTGVVWLLSFLLGITYVGQLFMLFHVAASFPMLSLVLDGYHPPFRTNGLIKDG